MRNYNYILLAGVALFAFAACNKEINQDDPAQVNGPVYETIGVKLGVESKVTLSGGGAKSAFEEGDKIAVWTEAGNFQTCAVDGSGKITVDISGGVRSNYAVYYNGTTDPTYVGSTLTITLPDSYNYADVSGTKNPVPMVAKNVSGDAADMVFYAVGALVRLTVSAIPSTADKLVVTFDKDVTGSFDVTGPGTATPSISTSSSTTKNVVTINLVARTDYTGAVINIPVPTGTVSVGSVVAKAGSTTLSTVNTVISDWTAARAHGKAAAVAYTPSIASLIVSPGNLYTDGSGDLHMADNYYEHAYHLESNDDYLAADSYKYTNRTHFFFNETYLLLSGGTPTKDNFRVVANVDFTGVETVIGGKTWVLPNGPDYLKMVDRGNTYRPGATVNGVPGYKCLRVMVNEMSGAGTSSSKGNSSLDPSVTDPNTDYQSGLLFFPDNVSIETTASLKTPADVAANPIYDCWANALSKAQMDALVGAGCAFYPALGRWYTDHDTFDFVGQYCDYWSTDHSGPISSTTLYYLYVTATNTTVNSLAAVGYCRPIRLVRPID